MLSVLRASWSVLALRRLSATGVAGQLGSFVRCFPREVGIVAAEVAVGRGLAVDRTAQVQRLDDALAASA